MKLTAESTVLNDEKLDEDITEARTIATNTAQYFWFKETGTDTGAHISEVKQSEFEADPSGGNLLANSNGIAVRDGLAELATFGAGKIALRDGERDYFAVQTVAGNLKAIKYYQAVLNGNVVIGNAYQDIIKLGRTVSSLTSIKVQYLLGSTAKTQTFTSFPVSWSDANYTRIQLSLVNDNTAIRFYMDQGGESITTIQSIEINYVTEEITAEVNAGMYFNDTGSGALRLGNGTSDTDKSNAMVVGWDGTARFNGDVYARCNADSTGGIPLSGTEYLGTVYESTTVDPDVTINCYRSGKVANLFINIFKSASVASGGNIFSISNVQSTKIPPPAGAFASVSGCAYYGAHPIIASLYFSSNEVWAFNIRNASPTAVTLDEGVRISMTYLISDDETWQTY